MHVAVSTGYQNYKPLAYDGFLYTERLLEIELVGFFKFETTLEPERIEKLLRINATAILFPYLRSIVSSITANSGFQTLVLPIVNIHKMLEQQETEEENERE